MRTTTRLLTMLMRRGSTQRRCPTDRIRRPMRRSVRRRVDILRSRSSRHRTPIRLYLLQQPQPILDGLVIRVQVRRPRIRINGVPDLIVTALVQTAEVEPDFGDVRVDPDGAGVGVEGVAVLVDVVVEDADAAPERRVAAVSVYGLLVCLVRLLVFLYGHEGAAEEVPALGVGAVGFQALGETVDGHVLVGESGAGLVVEPSELLEDFCVVRALGEDALVSFFGLFELRWKSV